MATVQAAFLANAASTEASGLVSVLGAFVDSVSAPQLPHWAQLWLVARLLVEDGDLELPHVFSLQVEHADGERLMRVDGTSNLQTPSSPLLTDVPVGFLMVLPCVVEFRRQGVYSVRLTWDGELLVERLVRVRQLLPNI